MVMNSTECCHFFFGHENFGGKVVSLLEETSKIPIYLPNETFYLIFLIQYLVHRCI